jgi:hypothetical protein
MARGDRARGPARRRPTRLGRSNEVSSVLDQAIAVARRLDMLSVLADAMERQAYLAGVHHSLWATRPAAWMARTRRQVASTFALYFARDPILPEASATKGQVATNASEASGFARLPNTPGKRAGQRR